MAERLSSGSERRARRGRAEADARHVAVADTAYESTPPSPPHVERAESAAEMPAASAAVHSDAAQLQERAYDEAARQMRVDRGDVMGWWRRKFNLVSNAVLGASVFSGTNFVAGQALAGSMIAATLPGWMIALAVGVPAVLIARYGLGLNIADRAAKAGRVADKVDKKLQKARRAAERAGGTFAVSDAALQEQIQNMSKRRAWGPMAASIATGALFGAVSYEMASGNLTFSQISDAGADAGEKASGWWRESMNWLWGKACGIGSVTSSEAPFTSLTGEPSPYPPPAPVATHFDAAGEWELERQLYSDGVDWQARSAAEAAASDARLAEWQGERAAVGESIANRPVPTPEAAAVRPDVAPSVADAATQETAPERMPADVPLAERVTPAPATPADPTLAPDNDPAITESADRIIPRQENVSVTIGGPDSPIAKYGVDGLMKGSFFADTVVWDAFPLSTGAKEQFIDAVRRTLVDNPQFAQLLGDGISVRGSDIIFPDSGIVDMRVFGSNAFLDALEKNITTFERSYLVPELGRSSNGLDGLLDLIHTRYGRA